MNLTIEFPNPPRSSFGCALFDQTLHIVGGHLGKFHHYDAPHFCANGHTVNLRTGKVGQIDYPFPAQGFRIIEYHGELFGFGGFVYESGLDRGPGADEFDWYARTTNEVFKLDAQKSRWETIGHLPRPRSSYVLGKIDKCAYLIGGWDGTPWKKDDWRGRFHCSVEVFDLEQRKFIPNTIIGPTPPRRALTATIFDKQVLLIGGLTEPTDSNPEGNSLNNVTAFDPIKGTFRDDLFPPLPKGLFSPGACNVEGTLVVAGGVDLISHEQNSEVFLLHPGHKDWITNTTKPSKMGSFPELFHLGNREVLILGAHDTSDTNEPLGLFETILIDDVN